MNVPRDTNLRTVGTLLYTAIRQFERCGIDTPRLDAEVLLADVLQKPRTLLYSNLEHRVTDTELHRFEAYINRRMQREPVAYIIGHKEFWSLSLFVDQNVLIPRPETELLVETALGCLRAADHDGRQTHVLELGTGSGAIAIALAQETNHAVITATDRSLAALRVAQKNINTHGYQHRIHLVCGDWAHMIACRGMFDLIVANPPYIPSCTLQNLAPEIKNFEPPLALDGGYDGLAFYQRWVPLLWDLVRAGGWVAFEIGEGQAERVTCCMTTTGTACNVRCVSDYANWKRVVLAQKSNKDL